METVRQPFNVNHEGTCFHEYVNMEESEAVIFMTTADMDSDIVFFASLMKLLFDSKSNRCSKVLPAIVGGIYGEKYDYKTELIEKLVNTITDRESRLFILNMIAVTDDGFNDFLKEGLK